MGVGLLSWNNWESFSWGKCSRPQQCCLNDMKAEGTLALGMSKTPNLPGALPNSGSHGPLPHGPDLATAGDTSQVAPVLRTCLPVQEI